MNKLIIATTTIILALVFVAPGVLAIPIKVIPFNDQPGYSTDYKKGIFGKHLTTQIFTSQEEALTGIGLSIGNPNLKNKKDVNLTLYDEKGKMMQKSVLNGLNISDGSFVRFLFEPLTDSKNKKYIFTLESPNAGDEEVINIFFSRSHPDWIGELKYDTEVLDGSMPLVTYHKQGKFRTIKDIYTSLIRRITGSN